MINLTEYSRYWAGAIENSSVIDQSLPVTIDKEMAKKIQSLSKESTTLFILPPMAAISGRTVDSIRSEQACVLFVMKRYDPMRVSSFQVLEETQHAVHEVVESLLSEFGHSCSRWQIDLSNIDVLPETEFFAGFAGWSIGFKLIENG